jgi:cell division protein FtsQ
VRRVRRDPLVASGASAALARRGRRRRRTAKLGTAVQGLRRQPGRLMLLAAAGALGLALAGVVATGADRIRGAQVTGQHRVSAQAIYAASGLDGHGVLGIDTAAAAARVAALDGIRRAEVRVGWPARAQIRVEESRLALLWQGETGLLAVDEDGLAMAAPADAAGLAVVRDLAGTLRGPGDRLAPGLVAAALAFAARFGALTYQPAVGFAATDPAGWEIRLGTDAHQAARQSELVGAFRAQLSDQADRVALLDLRFVERPYYRLRGGSE